MLQVYDIGTEKKDSLFPVDDKMSEHICSSGTDLTLGWIPFIVGGTPLYTDSVSIALLPSSCELFMVGWLGRILLAHDISGATTFIAGTERRFVTLYTLEAEEGVVGEVLVVVVVEGGWILSLPSLAESCSVLVRMSTAVSWEQDVTGKLLGLEHLLTPLSSVVSV